METRNFNLDEAVKTHVQKLQDRGSITAADAVELSGHLYDATEELSKQQLTLEEAFIISAKRLGSNEVLHAEYSKVNPSLNVNKVWAYIILGFNLLYTLPSITYILLVAISNWALRTYAASVTTTLIVSTLNIMVCLAIIYAAKQKQAIARFVENCVENKVMRTILWSFLPLFITMAYKFFYPRIVAPRSAAIFLNDFKSAWVEFSYCMIFITFSLAALSLIVSISKFEKLTAKNIFQKPTPAFLLFFGLIVECMAAATRLIRLPRELYPEADIIFGSLLFAMVYFIPALLIARYNNQHQWKYLLLFSAFGLVLETSVGINADLSRGGTYYTAFFVSALILGVAAGKYLGNNIKHKQHLYA